MSVDSDDETPQLSKQTLLALQEFYSEQENSIKTPQNFEENWQLSQFWYDDGTIKSFVKIASKTLGTHGALALISCPTLYRPMKDSLECCEINLFEFDDRFAVYGSDFVFYDYNSPTTLPSNVKNRFDLVIADPPFLSEECLTKTAATIKLMSKGKIILCTGAIMADVAARILNVQKCNFEPRHRNNLANEFCCYSNYDVDLLI